MLNGYSVGLLIMEDINYPIMPGNVMNAFTYDFPVYMMAVPNLTNDRLANADPTIADDIITTAHHLVEKIGVRAICSACGFFGRFHRQVAAAIDVPVAMSSLVQLPMIRNIIKPDQKVGILSANGPGVTPQLFESCNIGEYKNIIVKGLENTEHFSAVLDNRGYFDNDKVCEEVVGAALELLEEDKSIGAILLECSDMPPYSKAIQDATRLPVFDFTTLIRWLHNAAAQRHYSG